MATAYGDSARDHTFLLHEETLSHSRLGRAFTWGGIAVVALLLAKLVLGGFALTVAGFGEYLRDVRDDMSSEALLFFAGSLLEALIAVRRDIDGSRRYLASTRAMLPFINELTASSLLMSVARPLLEKSADIERFGSKKRELVSCLFVHSEKILDVILDHQYWLTEAELFEKVKSKVANLAVAGGEQKALSAYLMSLIAPEEWARQQWADYQEKLYGARVRARERNIRVDFKRIHVLHERDANSEAGWNDLVNVMLAEAIMGFSVQAMILNPQNVHPMVPHAEIGYVAHGIHLYDYGVYQGVGDRLVVLADSGPYFMGERARESSLVSDNTALLDILRRNFNLAWRSQITLSVYDVLLRRPDGSGSIRSASAIGRFLHGVAHGDRKIAAIQKVVTTDLKEYRSKVEFWKAFDDALADA